MLSVQDFLASDNPTVLVRGRARGLRLPIRRPVNELLFPYIKFYIHIYIFFFVKPSLFLCCRMYFQSSARQMDHEHAWSWRLIRYNPKHDLKRHVFNSFLTSICFWQTKKMKRKNKGVGRRDREGDRDILRYIRSNQIWLV